MIRISLFDDMTLCTDAEVERMALVVPEARRSQAFKFRHTFGRFACLKSYLMLADLLRSEFGIEEFRMEVEEFGKPYLVDHTGVFFNISHCQKAIAVAVSDKPVGIDVESFRHFGDWQIFPEKNHFVAQLHIGNVGYIDHGRVHTDVANDWNFLATNQNRPHSIAQFSVETVGIANRNHGDF